MFTFYPHLRFQIRPENTEKTSALESRSSHGRIQGGGDTGGRLPLFESIGQLFIEKCIVQQWKTLQSNFEKKIEHEYFA